MRRHPWLIPVLSIVALSGCECGSPVSEDAPSSGDTGVADVPMSRMDVGSPADASSDGPMVSPDLGPLSDAPGAITLSAEGVYADCMPIVSPDPVIAFWNVDVAATGTEARFVSGTLTVRNGARTATQAITVSNPVIPLVAGVGGAKQRKDSGTPAIDGCAYCEPGSTAHISLLFDVGGVIIPAELDTTFSCAF